MQAAIIDIYTQIVQSISTYANEEALTALPDNQRWLTDSQWSAAPTAGQMWDSAIPAHFFAPPPLQSMSQADFATAIAPMMSALWAAAASNNSVAQFFVQGLINPTIERAIAQPAMAELEAAGVLPAGTTASIWGS